MARYQQPIWGIGADLNQLNFIYRELQVDQKDIAYLTENINKILSTSPFAKEPSKETNPLAKYKDYESYTKSKILGDHRVSTHNYARKTQILNEYPDVTGAEIDEWLILVWTKWVMQRSSNIRSERKAAGSVAKKVEKKPSGETSSPGKEIIRVQNTGGIVKPVKEEMNPLIKETLKGWIKGRRVSLRELMKFIADEMGETEDEVVN